VGEPFSYELISLLYLSKTFFFEPGSPVLTFHSRCGGTGPKDNDLMGAPLCSRPGDGDTLASVFFFVKGWPSRAFFGSRAWHYAERFWEVAARSRVCQISTRVFPSFPFSPTKRLPPPFSFPGSFVLARLNFPIFVRIFSFGNALFLQRVLELSTWVRRGWYSPLKRSIAEEFFHPAGASSLQIKLL